MAVAIPLLASAAAGAVGLGTVAATAVSIGAGLVAAKTGISAKVDKAAGKVFGRDAVKVFNIAGTVYGAMGGFAGQGPGQVWDNISGAFGGAAASASSVPGTGIDATGGMETAVDSFGYVAQPDIGAMGGDYAGTQYQQQPQVDGALPAVRGQPPGAPAASGAGAQGPGTADKIKAWWDNAGDRTRAQVLQLGGQVIAGIADGASREKEIKAAEARDARYRSGSTRRWSGGALADYNQHYAGKGP